MRVIQSTIPTMPYRHGICRRENQQVGLFGVWDLFEILARSPFRTTPLGPPHIHIPTNLAFHFRQTLRLLFYNLDVFQQKCTAFVEFIEDGGLGGPNPKAFYDIQDEANATAQGILLTLTIVLDDVARIIPFVLFPSPTNSQEAKAGFSQFKKHILPKYPNASTVQQLRDLFSELDDKSSWWEIAFDYGIGMRQRLSHYADLIILSYETKPLFQLVSVGTSEYKVDFLSELRNLLHGLCDWLDKLDALMIQHLSARADDEGLNWTPSKNCPGYSLPVVGSAIDRIVPVDYLYLPLCTPRHENSNILNSHRSGALS